MSIRATHRDERGQWVFESDTAYSGKDGPAMRRAMARIKAPRPTKAMVRLAERVLEKRDEARRYSPTGLHPDAVRAFRHALKARGEARQAFIRKAVQWGALRDDARSQLQALLAADEEGRSRAVRRAANWLARLGDDAQRNP